MPAVRFPRWFFWIPDFTNLPHVVMEGRKVIHNVTRTAQVFFIKTIYSVLVSFFCLFTNQAVPVYPDPDYADRCLHRSISVLLYDL